MKRIICFACDGIGIIEEDIGTHQSEYIHHTCSKCKGRGMLLYKDYSFQLIVSVDEISKFHDIDEKIIEQIRTWDLAMY